MKNHLQFALLFAFASVLCVSCGSGGTQKSESAEAPSGEPALYVNECLEPLWQTPADLKVPESVIYDAARNQIIATNIVGSPMEKDGEGYLSRIDIDGNILNLKWLEGLNAPKGMGIYGDYLYVADIDRVVQFDIVKEQEVAVYEVEGSLNDIDVDAEGNVYISDPGNNTIYRISGGEIAKWTDDPVLKGPNGLFVDGENLLAGISDAIVSFPLKGGAPVVLYTGTGGIDGLEKAEEGAYLFSDWKGNVSLGGPGKEKVNIFDGTAVSINAADIEFVPEKGLLLIPSFFDNRILAYRLKK